MGLPGISGLEHKPGSQETIPEKRQGQNTSVTLARKLYVCQYHLSLSGASNKVTADNLFLARINLQADLTEWNSSETWNAIYYCFQQTKINCSNLGWKKNAILHEPCLLSISLFYHLRVFYFVCCTIALLFSEPTFWKPPAKIQKQQWVAEALGGVHQLLHVFLQISSGNSFFWKQKIIFMLSFSH